MRPYQSQGSGLSEPRSVNNLLHTLRGEQFRHTQNVLRSRIHISSTVPQTHSHAPHLVDPDYDHHDPGSLKAEVSPFKNCSGPEPPKSWRLNTKIDSSLHTTSAWRAQALDLILRDRGVRSPMAQVPPLTQLCLWIISSFPYSEFSEDIVPFLPAHLCRDLIRFTAIHAPLSPSKLYATYAHDGHADGELLVVGPQATLRNFFVRDHNSDRSTSQDLLEWESEKPMPPSLCTFILMFTPVTLSTILSLPPTITHIALLNLPAPIALHRLPGVCPLLELLDLSYNSWLSPTSRDASTILERVEWSRWSRLRVLGLRNCLVSNEMLQKLNKGRWDDVQVVDS